MDENVPPVKLPGFGQMGIGAIPPQTVGNPKAQPALFRVAQRAFGTSITKQKRAQLTFEMYVLDTSRREILL